MRPLMFLFLSDNGVQHSVSLDLCGHQHVHCYTDLCTLYGFMSVSTGCICSVLLELDLGAWSCMSLTNNGLLGKTQEKRVMGQVSHEKREHFQESHQLQMRLYQKQSLSSREKLTILFERFPSKQEKCKKILVSTVFLTIQ